MQKKNIIIGAILLVVIIVLLVFVFKKNRGKENFKKNMIEKREERMERNRNLEEEGEIEVDDKKMEKPVEQQDDNMGNDLEELRKNDDQLDKEIDDLETSDF